LYYGDGVITDTEPLMVDSVSCFAQIYRFGGTSEHMPKNLQRMDMAQNGRTYDRFNDSGGARIQEGVRLWGVCLIFYRNVR
jgi:acetyl-CoA carboxylase carboxyltransferase component